jgi:hypothetical protein
VLCDIEVYSDLMKPSFDNVPSCVKIISSCVIFLYNHVTLHFETCEHCLTSVCTRPFTSLHYIQSLIEIVHQSVSLEFCHICHASLSFLPRR